MVSTGQVFKGARIGVDQYNLLRPESGLELLFNKGNDVYIHRVLAKS